MVFYREGKHKNKRLGLKEAKLKAADYCAYQERSQQEVRNKLYTYGLDPDEVEQALTDLIVEGFINEERFARAYAGGKFRIKGWGRHKILQGLKQHKLSDYCIRKGLEVIDPEAYYETLKRHALKKMASIQEKNHYEIRNRLNHHLAMKGFEADLIEKVMDELEGW